MNFHWTQYLSGVGAVALMLAWAVAAHFGSIGVGNVAFNAVLALITLLLAWTVLLWQLRNAWVRAVGVLVAFCVVLVLWIAMKQNVQLLYFVDNLGCQLALAGLFARTLIGPREPLVTRLARYIFPDPLSERKLRYTRSVTWAWTLFFVCNALTSAVLYFCAPPVAWSVYANLMSGPLIALMFLAEHLLRKRILPPHERPSLAAVIKAYRARSADAAQAVRSPRSGA